MPARLFLARERFILINVIVSTPWRRQSFIWAMNVVVKSRSVSELNGDVRFESKCTEI